MIEAKAKWKHRDQNIVVLPLPQVPAEDKIFRLLGCRFQADLQGLLPEVCSVTANAIPAGDLLRSGSSLSTKSQRK